MSEITVDIHALAHGGAGVGTITAGEEESLLGKTVFVRETIPGETVTAIIVEDKKNFVNANLLTILQPSPHRTKPICPIFGQCGGCDLQHIENLHQRELKLEMVRSALEKQGDLKPTRGVSSLSDGLPMLGYRRRVIFHLSKHGEVCYYAKGSRRMLPVEHCPIARPEVNDMLSRLRKSCSNLGPLIEDLVAEVCDGQEILEVRMWRKIKVPTPEMVKQIDDALSPHFKNLVIAHHSIVQLTRWAGNIASAEELTFPVGHFAQVNEVGNRVLQEAVLKYSDCGDEITEFYAGAGNFTFPLAKRAKKVVAIEADRHLVKFGQEYANKAGLGSVIEFVRRSCEKYARKFKFLPVVILDPPRSGAIEVAEKCNTTDTKRIVYVSCALPTFIRDLKVLVTQGFFLDEVFVVDMFPQTHHVETIAILSAPSQLQNQ